MAIKRFDSNVLSSLKNILKKFPNGGKVLDFGAGNGASKTLFPSNWEWTGMDIMPLSDNVKQGDAHNLDFPDDSFDLVVSIAVFEHLHSPWIAIKEVSRVLKKGGLFLGTVAFLEPEHGNSYFHMTKRGMSKIIEEGGLVEEFIEPVKGWNVATSMRLIPIPGIKLYNRFRSFLVFGLRSFMLNLRIMTLSGERKIRALKFKEGERYRYSGSFLFLAKKD